MFLTLCFFSSIRVDPGPYIVTSPENRYPRGKHGEIKVHRSNARDQDKSHYNLKYYTTVNQGGGLFWILSESNLSLEEQIWLNECIYLADYFKLRKKKKKQNRGPTSLLALEIRTPVANTGKLRSIGQVPVAMTAFTDQYSLPNISFYIGPGSWVHTNTRNKHKVSNQMAGYC
jgi:hypothetical protein